MFENCNSLCQCSFHSIRSLLAVETSFTKSCVDMFALWKLKRTEIERFSLACANMVTMVMFFSSIHRFSYVNTGLLNELDVENYFKESAASVSFFSSFFFWWKMSELKVGETKWKSITTLVKKWVKRIRIHKRWVSSIF